MSLDYEFGSGEAKNWLIAEDSFDPAYLGKIETLFSLGNGYMGLRTTTEEPYAGDVRGFYIAGVFDAFPGEVTELANLPDWTSLEIAIDGERFSCDSGVVLFSRRYIDLRCGVVSRSIDWESPSGKQVSMLFERFLSMDEVHSGVLRAAIRPINFSGRVGIRSGINGQVTNSGVQHLRDGALRLLPEGTIALVAQTQQSGIGVCIAAGHRYQLDGHAVPARVRSQAQRRRIDLVSEVKVEKGVTLRVTKFAAVFTDRDGATGAVERPRRQASSDIQLGSDEANESPLLDAAASLVASNAEQGYDALVAAHRSKWRELWKRVEVRLDGPDFDQLALRFALFHLLQMTPRHDSSVSIAAKGLTGEGYKGHVFWDTEIFILPVFSYTMPEVAAQLLEYRYRTLGGARAKATNAGMRGAMFAWESADSGAETTPRYWGVDVATGRPIRVWSGDIELHINADIPYSIWLYHQVSGDVDFMLSKGLEIIFETARFWASRVEWNPKAGRYELIDVMGPDEYGEHVSNNAYTNCLVRWHLQTAAELYERFLDGYPADVERIAATISLHAVEVRDWAAKAEKIFTNFDKSSGLIHEYDGFTDKAAIDLARYQGRAGAITADYGWSALMQMQITKQADVVMLLYLRGDDFSAEVKRFNWSYYEPKTLHDSSLSPAIHSIVASDIGYEHQAYEYFLRAARVDLGHEPAGSDSGVHAASLGGIWQAAINGFAGVRVTDMGVLRVSPRLPLRWKRISFPIRWRETLLDIDVTKTEIAFRVSEESGPSFLVESNGVTYTHPGRGILTIPLAR